MNVSLRRFHTHTVFLLLLSALFAGFAVTACAVTYDHATWRYRMTVTVETPEGLKTGSAVREVSAFREPKLMPEQTSGHAALSKGEAVVVDLGKRGVLFALMRGGRSDEDYGYRVVFDAFPYPSKNGGGQLTSGGIDYYSHLKAGPVELPQDDYPIFARFKDLNDFKTIEAVPATDFASAFGAGVHLKSVTIEMTTDPITAAIVQHLPKFGPDYFNWFKTLKYGDPRRVGPYDFKKGVSQQ